MLRPIVITCSWLAGLASWRLVGTPRWTEFAKSLFMVNLTLLVLYAFIKNDFFSNITFAWMFVIPLYLLATVGVRYAFISLSIFAVFVLAVLAAQIFDYIPSEEDFVSSYRVNKYIQLPLMFTMAAYSIYSFNQINQQNAQQLRRALDNEVIANKSKDAFLSNISHELRTPLSGISGVLQILKGKDEKAATIYLIS